MADPIRQEGFLVFRQVSAAELRFFKARNAAEIAAKQLVKSDHPVDVVPVVRFTIKPTQQSRPDAAD